MCMRRPMGLVMALAVLAAGMAPAQAQQKSTLDKIGETGTVTVGTRTGSPPFGYVNSQNQWVGFSIDLVEELIKPALEKKLGKPIKVERKESAPPTRIPLLSSSAVDLIAETMTDTRTRRESVDFSLTFFVTGAQFIVKKGSKVRSIKDIDGKRIAAQQGSTNARIIRAKAANPALWEIVGDFYSYEPYGMAMRKNDSDFRSVVNAALMDGIENGKYFELYDKWFGAKGELPYPMSAAVRTFMLYQVVPK